MQSITQLLETIKKFHAETYIFLTNIEPLVLSENLSESIKKELNSIEVVQMLDSAMSSLENLNKFLTVVNPIITEEIKRLKSCHKSKKDKTIPYADLKLMRLQFLKKIQLSSN